MSKLLFPLAFGSSSVGVAGFFLDNPVTASARQTALLLPWDGALMTIGGILIIHLLLKHYRT